MAAPVAAPAEQDWEASKENFQPLKSGRKATALRDSTAELRTQAIEDKRRAFWEELAGYSGNDPLEVWLRFIKWTQEAFSAGGHKAELLPLLERCTRELQTDAKYTADIRYLRVWIQYADCLPDPGDVFVFLKENDIGQEHALYYLAFATYLETRANFARADSVYQQGINRLAAPVERLRIKFQDFQQRMARRIQRKAQEQLLEATDAEHPERKSLGLLGGRKSARPGAGLLGGAAGLKRKTVDQENAALGSDGSGSGLDIFVDEEYSALGAPAASAPAALFQAGRSAAAPWTKLGGFEQNRKENVQRAGMWAGQKIKQQPTHSAPAAPALEIFADPELQELDEQQAAAAGAAGASKPTLRQRLDKGGQGIAEEGIMQNPLHLHLQAQATAALDPLPAVAGQPHAQDAKRRREEVMAFDQAALTDSTGEELCFEEVRGGQWLQLRAAQQASEAAAAAAAAEEAEEDQPDMDLEGDTCAVAFPAEASNLVVAAEAAQQAPASPQSLGQPLSPVPAHAFGSPVAVDVVARPAQATAVPAASPGAPVDADHGADLNAAALAEPASRPTPFEQQAADPGYDPTVTLSSRDALAAINQMSGGVLPADSVPAQVFGRAAGSSGFAANLDPTMTIATKDALAALNNMFKGSLPMEHSSLPPNPYAEPTLPFGRAFGGGGGGALDPTMTISTKAAFDAINSMFKGALQEEHGCLPPTASGPAGYDPTMTISTKAALDAINQMFGGGSGGDAAASARPAPSAGTGQQHGSFRVPAPRPPRAQQAAIPAPTSAVAAAESPAGCGGFDIREDTHFVSVPLERLDDEAASPAAGCGGASPGCFNIREDTQFFTVAAGGADHDGDDDTGGGAMEAGAGSLQGSPAAGGGGFLIREDTQCITVAVQRDSDDDDEQQEVEEQQQPEEEEEHEPQQQLGAWQSSSPAVAPGGGGGFCIREDTQFVSAADLLGGAGGAACSGGFDIREDTQFFGGGSAGSGGSPSSCSDGGGNSSGRLSRKRPLSDYGDDGSTGDLLGSGSPALSGSPAHSANAAQVNKWGFAPGADDTLALDLGDTQQLLDAVSAAAAADPAAASQLQAVAGGGSSPSLTEHLQGLQLADCKENLLPQHCAVGSGRSLADPAVAGAVLQPLAAGRAAELGVEMEADEVAEAQLATAVNADLAAPAAEDSFMVYAYDGSPPLMGSPVSSFDRDTQAGDEQQQEEWVASAVQQSAEAAAAAVVVDPFSPRFHARMMSCLEPAVSEWPGVCCISAEEEAEVECGFKAAGRSSASLVELQLCGQEFAVSGCIGEGAYAKVFQGVDGDCADVALKLEAPPCPWEWYICKVLAGRVPEAARRHFIDPSALLLGQQNSVLVAPLGAHGSLQDLLNGYLAQQQTPPEAVVMYFAAEMLRVVRQLHAARILHTDIKPDNLLVTLDLEAGGDENAGPALGLEMIDFGRSVDLELLPPGALLQGDSGTDAFRCVQMREGTPWVWQADAYGVAATVHTLLHGNYMQVERVMDNATGAVSVRPTQPFKRQWAGDLWGAFFLRTLNHTDALAPPAVDDLIAGFEAHLGSREVARRLRQELSAAASLLPKRC